MMQLSVKASKKPKQPKKHKMAEPQNGDTRIRRVITAIDAAGHAFSECHGETFVGGRWFPDDPKSLANAGPEADDWKTLYSGAIESERDALKVERDAAQKALTDAETSHAATVATMQAEIDRLTALVPVPQGPRQITRREFSARFDAMAPGKMRKIWDSDSDIAFQVCLALFTWDGPIDLDSPLLAQLLGGLVQTGFLTSDEMTAIIGA